MFKSDTEGIIIFTAICTITILILIAFVVIIIYRYKQNQNLYFKSIEELEIVHRNAILQSQIEIQEQTFQNISRELHDNVGQKLSLVKLSINTIANAGFPEINDQLMSSAQVLTEAIDDVRDISRSMSSEQILANGLENALKHEVAFLKNAGIHNVNMVVEGNIFYQDKSVELILFRIIQEAFNNIIKHANATAISIKLIYSDPDFLLLIHDNGAGFQPDDIIRSGIGLANMKTRAKTINADCTIQSNTNDGTILKIKIPAND